MQYDAKSVNVNLKCLLALVMKHSKLTRLGLMDIIKFKQDKNSPDLDSAHSNTLKNP